MLLSDGDLFTTDCNAICIPTNGYVSSNLTIILGAGVARQAAEYWPGLPDILGTLIYRKGNAVHLVTTKGPKFQTGDAYLGTLVVPYHIVTFPTKPAKVNILTTEDVDRISSRYRPEAEALLAPPKNTRDIKWLPGWKAKADLAIMKHSCEELVELADEMGWKKVCLPRVGCAAGELEWAQVAELLRKHLDQRFVVMNRK